MSQFTTGHAFQAALQQHQAGRLAQAEASYRQVLAQSPNHADAHHMLGVIARQTGQNNLAAVLIRKAIALNPELPDAHSNLGLILNDLGDQEQAIAEFHRAIALRPHFPEAYNNLGNTLKEMGRFDESVVACRQAIALRPDYPEAYNNLGNALREKKEIDEAIAACKRAIALRPDFPEAHNNLGNALRDQSQLDNAIAAYRNAIALQPRYAEAYSNWGAALWDLRRFDEAIAAYRQAITLRPDFAQAYYNLANALKEIGQLDAAVTAYRQALALQPAYADAHSNLGSVLKDMGQLDDALAACRQAVAFAPDNPQIASNLVYALHFHPDYDAAAIYREHQLWNQRHAEPLRRFIQSHSNDRAPERRLRIGYVSPDLREHPVGRFLLPLVTHHDHQRFEVFAYDAGSIADGLTGELRSHADHWRSLAHLTDDQAAQLVRDDRIDILIDLTMHMAGNRLMLFARKPAPVQVTYLAYVSTTGLPAIDYRISDPHLDPPGGPQKIYAEKTILLPETYWCYQPVATPELTPLPARRAGHITFACLNNFCKAAAPTLAAWAGLLRAVPHSRLLLHAHEGSHRRRTSDFFQQHGVEARRISFSGLVPMSEYLRLYETIDIALDPFPYGGGTTTCDALWMGVPVVTLAGATAVGRGGLTILSNVGTPELVAYSPEDYQRTAGALAHDLPRLEVLRSSLRRRMAESPLMDAPRFAQNMEAAYRQMWREWCAAPVSYAQPAPDPIRP